MDLSAVLVELHHLAHHVRRDNDDAYKDFVVEYLKPLLFLLGDPLEIDSVRMYSEAVAAPRDEILHSLLRSLLVGIKSHTSAGAAFSLISVRKLVFQSIQRVGEVRTSHYEAQYNAFESSLRSRNTEDTSAVRYYYSSAIAENLFTVHTCSKCYPNFQVPQSKTFTEEGMTVAYDLQVDHAGEFVTKVTVQCCKPCVELRDMNISVIPDSGSAMIHSIIAGSHVSQNNVKDSHTHTAMEVWSVNYPSVSLGSERTFLIMGKTSVSPPVVLRLECPRMLFAHPTQKIRRLCTIVSQVLSIPLICVRMLMLETEDQATTTHQSVENNPFTTLILQFVRDGDVKPALCRQRFLTLFAEGDLRVTKLGGYGIKILPESTCQTVPTFEIHFTYTFFIPEDDEPSELTSFQVSKPVDTSVSSETIGRRRISFTAGSQCKTHCTIPVEVMENSINPLNWNVRNEIFRQQLSTMLMDYTQQSHSFSPSQVVDSVRTILNESQYRPPASLVTTSFEVLELRFSVWEHCGDGRLSSQSAVTNMIRSFGEQEFVPSTTKVNESHWVRIQPMLSTNELALYKSIISLAFINRESSDFILQRYRELAPRKLPEFPPTTSPNISQQVDLSNPPTASKGLTYTKQQRSPIAPRHEIIVQDDHTNDTAAGVSPLRSFYRQRGVDTRQRIVQTQQEICERKKMAWKKEVKLEQERKKASREFSKSPKRSPVAVTRSKSSQRTEQMDALEKAVDQVQGDIQNLIDFLEVQEKKFPH